MLTDPRKSRNINHLCANNGALGIFFTAAELKDLDIAIG